MELIKLSQQYDAIALASIIRGLLERIKQLENRIKQLENP